MKHVPKLVFSSYPQIPKPRKVGMKNLFLLLSLAFSSRMMASEVNHQIRLHDISPASFICTSFPNGYSRATWDIYGIKELAELSTFERVDLDSWEWDEQDRCELVRDIIDELHANSETIDVDANIVTTTTDHEFETCDRPGGVYTGCTGQTTYTVCWTDVWERLEVRFWNGLVLKDWVDQHKIIKRRGRCL